MPVRDAITTGLGKPATNDGMLLPMHAVIFTGIQASGKSTFYRDRFWQTHVRLNRDMLRSQQREEVLLHACLAVGQPLVVDNTNPMAKTRQRYLSLARAAGFAVDLYYFESAVEEAIARNAMRAESVPEVAVRGTFAKLQVPTADEGFDRLFRVTVRENQFVVAGWPNEI